VLAVDATFLNELTPSGDVIVHGVGFDLTADRPRMGTYLAEMMPDEFRRFTTGRFVLDEAVLPARRKDAMRLYTECLRPKGFRHYCVRIWSNPQGAFFMTILRDGRSARYAPGDLEDVNALQPILALGEALHASARGSTETSPNRDALYGAQGLTAAESVAFDLARCGLDVSDASRILGQKPEVVHQRVATAVAKLRARHATARGRPAPALPCTERPRRNTLSPRQLQTLQLLLAGLSDKDIADRLCISPHTVHDHTKRIYTHFGVHSRASLIARHGQSRLTVPVGSEGTPPDW
jgi:DNA-binding NarL/FixJ family response regulator